MPNYMHRGVVQANGLVDTAQTITDPAVLAIQPADNALRLTSLQIGNFEWWYFDVIDTRHGYVLKLVAHLGTDPLRTTFTPTVAVAVRTPHGQHVYRQQFVLDDLQASQEACDVRIKDAWHAALEPGTVVPTYHLSVTLPAFQATLRLQSQVPGWKPLGDTVPMQRGRKHARFLWVVPLPRATVEGVFTLDGVDYTLSEALGYHDHNMWQVDPSAPLFLDRAISAWYWGRFLGPDTTIVFMDTDLRTHHLRSCLLVTDETGIHSSNNLVIVTLDAVQYDATLRTTYPSRLTVALSDASCTWSMVLQANAVLDRRDFLADLHPLLKWCIRSLIAQPAYHGILADATVRLQGQEKHAAALYESMSLRRRARPR